MPKTPFLRKRAGFFAFGIGLRDRRDRTNPCREKYVADTFMRNHDQTGLTDHGKPYVTRAGFSSGFSYLGGVIPIK